MKRSHSPLSCLALAAGITAFCLGLIGLYTTTALHAARAEGLYASAEEGMRSRIARYYTGFDRYQIIYAGTNSFDGSIPHVWYVIACVWGGRRVDGSPTGSDRHVYDQLGSFFLDTRNGWVFIPEGAFPGFLGFWMKVFGQAGPGASHPSHDWDDAPQGECVF
jgi:hypothetical protein